MHQSTLPPPNQHRFRGLLCAIVCFALSGTPIHAADTTEDANSAATTDTSEAADGADTSNVADAADFDQAIASGKSSLEAGKIDEALSQFQYAVMLDGNQYVGFFYLAVATFRVGDHAAALEYGTAAVATAKGADKRRAQELLDAIRKAKETEELSRQGDDAQGKGLNAKAADSYARAFQLSPDRGDLGLKAAMLYANRLNRLLDAAVLYQGVFESGDATAADKAGYELGALHESLQKLYRDELPPAAKRGDAAVLEKLCKAFPLEAQPRVEMAVVKASKGDSAAVVHWLGEAVKLGASYDEVKARTVFLDLWEKDGSAIKTFIGDAFGAPAREDMNDRQKKRAAILANERRIAADKIRAEQAAQERARREAASRPLRHKLRGPVVEELNRVLQANPVKRIATKGPAKFFGGHEKRWESNQLTIELHGAGYLVRHININEYWGNTETTTFTTESLARLSGFTSGPLFDRSSAKGALHGSGDKFWKLGITFDGDVVLVEKSGSSGTDRINEAYGLFMINDPADGRRIEELFQALKAIDSMTLEQLREKTGGA